MAGAPNKENIKNYIITTSDEFGDYHVVGLDRFVDGTAVKIYLHSYGRMTTFDKEDNIYVVKNAEIGNNFIEKEEWRTIQLNKILGK
jgi:hypothetical protein